MTELLDDFSIILHSKFAVFFFQNGGGREMGEDEAARVIQAGFKKMSLKRRNTGSSIVTVVPNGDSNGKIAATAGAGELVVAVGRLLLLVVASKQPQWPQRYNIFAFRGPVGPQIKTLPSSTPAPPHRPRWERVLA